MKRNGRLNGLACFLTTAVIALATVCPGCTVDFGDFTSSSTVTLDGREVVTYLVRSLVLTPIQTYVDNGIDYIFDRLEDEDD